MKNRIVIALWLCTSSAVAQDLLKDASARTALALQDFEQFALSSNPTMQEANSLVQQSAEQAKQAGLLPNPSVGYQGEQIRGGAYGGGEQGVFVEQTIVLGGKLRLRKNVYQQLERESAVGLSEQRERVLGDVDESFYTALAAQEMVKSRRQLLALSRDAAETAHQLANVGQADEPDVLQAEVAEQRASLDYTAAQRDYVQKFEALAQVSGKPGLLLAPLQGNLENLPSIDTAQIVNRAIDDSPLAKRAEQAVITAETEVKSAEREAVPDLQLRGGLQQNSELLNALGERVVGVQGFATVGISLPIFNRNQGNIAAARANLERAKEDLVRVRLSLRRNAEPLVQQYLAGQNAAGVYKAQTIPLATRAYQLYLQKYQQMAAPYSQVLLSQRTLFELRVAYVGTLQDAWTAAAALQHFTLSGGLTAPLSAVTSP